MPTTAAGTVYTVTSFTSSFGEPCRRAVADNRAAAADVPLVIFCHGNPGSDPTSADFQFGAGYTALRERLLNAGIGYVEGRGAGAGWGNTAQRQAYRAMYQAAATAWDVGWVAVIGRSMGALVGAWLASQDPVIAPRCRGFLSLSGTANLSDRYATAGTTDRANLLAAYGASDEADFRAKCAPHDPLLAALATWDGRAAQMQWDTSDTTVPPGINGQAWRDRFGTRLAVNGLFTTSGGDHNTTPNDAAHATAAGDFLTSRLAAPFVPPDIATTLQLVGAGGALTSAQLHVVAGDLSLTPITIAGALT